MKKVEEECDKMKRNILSVLTFSVLIITTFMLMGCLSSNSDDDKGSTTGLRLSDIWGDVEQGRWDIGVGIWYSSYTSPIDPDNPHEPEPIFETGIGIHNINGYVFKGEVTLKINDVDVELEYGEYYGEAWFEAYYTFIQGNIYKISLTYDGRTHVANLRMPHQTTIASTIPSEFDPTRPFIIHWTKGLNTNIQAILVYIEDEILGEDVEIIDITPNARTYTIPANKFQANDVNWIGVVCLNYATSGRVIFTMESWAEVHDSWNDYYINSRITNQRKRMNSIVDLIENR